MKIKYKISFYLFAAFLLLAMGIIVPEKVFSQEPEPEPGPGAPSGSPYRAPPEIKVPKSLQEGEFKVPKDVPFPPFGNNIYIVWTQVFQGNTKLFLKKSTDGGNNFGPATTITSTNNGIPTQGYSIAIDSSKNIYVVWARDDGASTKLFLKKSTDGGNNFGPATTITSPNSDIWHSSIVLDSNKNIYVVWTEGPANAKEVYIKKSSNGGNSFGQATNLSNTPGNPSSSRMAIDSNNNIYVVWKESQVIYLRKSTDGSNSFGAATTINAPAVEGTHVAVYKNNTYVTWRTETQNDEIYLKKSTDGGNAFGSAINISNSPADSYNHHLAVYGNNIYVTWREDTQTGLKLLIKKSSNGGDSFGPENIIWQSPSNSDSVIPRIALASGNNVFAVWNDINIANIINPDNVIFFKKSINGGNTFNPSYPKIVNSGPGTPSYLPIIAVR